MDKKTEEELNKLVDRIKNYRKGFVFTVDYSQIPTKAKLNGVRLVLNKAIELGYIESISFDLSFDDITGDSGRMCSAETFKRL